jgi:alkanesulfonate monooxygenase SsuD/methylene tetrahydromethanopterin reductase-like flavin-dependent oxidoreductase (luciferase family)
LLPIAKIHRRKYKTNVARGAQTAAYHFPVTPDFAALDAILTYHVEGEQETPSRQVYDEIERQVRLADRLGYHAAWFAEHHFHVHRGHMPNPVLYALHLAARTEQILLGSAVITVALHHPLRLAEDLLTADVLSGGRLSIGLGSGSTGPEFTAFGVPADAQAAEARHRRFAEYLDVLEQVWSGQAIQVEGEYARVHAPPVLPRAIRPLQDALWIAANSTPQAKLAGERGYGVMLSRERSVSEIEALVAAYREGRRAANAGSPERIAASRALLVAHSRADAEHAAAEAVAIMVQRQRETRARYATLPPPTSFQEACQRVEFVAGSPEDVATNLRALGESVPFTAFHIQPRWQGLAPATVERTIRLFKEAVLPLAPSPL